MFWPDRRQTLEFLPTCSSSIRGPGPWKKEYAKAYVDQSPITHASAITASTLLLHNPGDFRVPITSSYAMYHALKDNGVTVKFLAFPGVGHEPSDAVHESHA
jgi:dipeptidyl aminopeptidase/acylaminoacyl peptidase